MNKHSNFVYNDFLGVLFLLEGCQLGVFWGTTTQRIINLKAFLQDLGTELFPFKNGWWCYFGEYWWWFFGRQLAFRQFLCLFCLEKTLVFKVKNNSFIDFLSKLSFSATILSFFKVHTISLFWKKLTCSGLPYFQINWVL